MVKELFQALTIPEDELPRVEPLFEWLLRGAVVVAFVLAGVAALLYLVSSTMALDVYGLWGVAVLVLLGGLLVLQRVHRSELIDTSVAVNFFLALFVLYATAADPLGFPIVGIHLLVYAASIAAATFLLTPAAALIWGGIATVGVLFQVIVAMVGAANFAPGMSVTWLLGVLLLHATTVVVWLVGRSFHETQMSLRRQIQQGRAGIEIGHTVSSSRDPSSVIRQAVQQIHQAFGYFHVGFYTVEPEGDSAVLADAAGEAASELLQRNFFVPLAGTSAVAAAVKHGRRWEVLSWQESVDPRGRPIEFTHDRLPMRAELVIPVLAGDRVFGALDVLSAELDPFTEENIHTLEGLVGNVANALEGTRLLADVQRSFEELAEAHAQTERRTRYLEATAELARATSTLLDMDELLSKATQLISTGLEFYHVGIFLLDDRQEWAVLVAASSEGGQKMLERGHRLRVGRQGIVGWVAEADQPRIALDVGEDAVFFSNPDLPDTHSEIALPLRAGDRTVGVLDVQTVKESAFGEEDAIVLQALADQVAIGIQHVRLFQETQRALEEVQTLQKYYVAQEWEQIIRRRTELEAEYRNRGVPSLETPWSPEMDMALVQGEAVVLSDLDAMDLKGNGRGDGRGDGRGGAGTSQYALSAMAVPIKLQEEVIGVLGLQEVDQKRRWTQEEVDMVTSVADQLALALENARLVEETQRRARQLAAASAVARDATAILDVEQLLNETVVLISERFGFYHAGVFLVDEQNEFAVMQAASSEGGQQMLARGHKLRIGEVGIVGHVTASGEPRVALDVGQDAAWFNAPELPETRSEMALPLKVRERTIGVLDVQSTTEAAFSEEDVAVLQTLADQLATAIDNANLFQRASDDAKRRTLINEVTQAAASSLDSAELLSRAGETMSGQLEMPCIIYDWDQSAQVLTPVTVRDSTGADVTPENPASITAAMDHDMFQAIRTHQRQIRFNVQAHASGAVAELARRLDLVDVAYMPLMSREQPLGLVALGRHQGHPALDEGELSFLEVVAANLGVALENARLFQDAVETAERLAEVDRLKTQFLATMSHELRTPLNSIIGFTRVILKEIDGPLTDLQRTDLQTVYDSGNHLLGLINNILDVMRIEAGKMEIAIEDVVIPEMVEGVLSVARALVKDKEVRLETDLADDLPVLKADGRRVRQVLINLVGNAAKFTEEGFIRVEARVAGEDVIFTVADSGIGIPKDKLAMIFEAFTQVDSSSTRKAGGTGLGLSICQSFVQMHNGSIWVESEVNKGSRFSFSLPIDGPSIGEDVEEELPEDKEVSTPPQEPAIEEPEEESKLVLCVEDDEGVITLFRRYLSKRGYQVQGLSDPTRVLDEAKRLHPHAITLDVMMPGKNGWQVIQELKADADTRHIPVIMCSIVADQDLGMSLGAADYLIKPVIEDDLLAALDRLDREAGHHLVLVVDDQPEHRQLLRRMIESQDGYEVVEASGGREAVDLLDHVHPHLIMLDLMMPEMDGFEVLEMVKGSDVTRSIPIVVVTAKELTDEDVERLNHHAEALIQKGLMKREELLEDVAAALKKLTRPMPVGSEQI